MSGHTDDDIEQRIDMAKVVIEKYVKHIQDKDLEAAGAYTKSIVGQLDASMTTSSSRTMPPTTATTTRHPSSPWAKTSSSSSPRSISWYYATAGRTPRAASSSS